MPGRAALTGIAAAKSDIASIQMGETPSGAGDMVGEYSPIGNDGRMGSDAYGQLSDPPYTRIDAQLVGKQEAGLATKGEQGVGTDGTQADYKHSSNAQGRTFHGSDRRRPED
jgi:hypothetical protein